MIGSCAPCPAPREAWVGMVEHLLRFPCSLPWVAQGGPAPCPLGWEGCYGLAQWWEGWDALWFPGSLPVLLELPLTHPGGYRGNSLCRCGVV